MAELDVTGIGQRMGGVRTHQRGRWRRQRTVA
jgi:hypothetical protein